MQESTTAALPPQPFSREQCRDAAALLSLLGPGLGSVCKSLVKGKLRSLWSPWHHLLEPSNNQRLCQPLGDPEVCLPKGENEHFLGWCVHSTV